MCKVIAIANQKGGVAKTTTTVNLGIGLARKGQRVLLIDADAQGSLTTSLGFRDQDSMDYTLATVLRKIKARKPYNPDEGILSHNEGIFLMPGNIETADLESGLIEAMRREYIMKQYIESVKNRFDWILIDCMPSLGIVTTNSLVAADSVLIPVQTGYLPAKGLYQLMDTIIDLIECKVNPDLYVEGILLTMLDERTNYTKNIVQQIKEGYGNDAYIFRSQIPMSVRVAECSGLGMSIYKHDGKCKAAGAYEALVQEVMEKAQNGGVS